MLLGRADIGARGCRNPKAMGWRSNGVPNHPDSRFRANDGVEIGNGEKIGGDGAIIARFSLMSTRKRGYSGGTPMLPWARTYSY